jgi:hypothetical protein
MNQAANLKNLEVPLLLPNIKVNTSPTNFYPIQSVRLQRFKGETWEYSLAAWLAFTPMQPAGEGTAGVTPSSAASPQADRVRVGE